MRREERGRQTKIVLRTSPDTGITVIEIEETSDEDEDEDADMESDGYEKII